MLQNITAYDNQVRGRVGAAADSERYSGIDVPAPIKGVEGCLEYGGAVDGRCFTWIVVLWECGGT